jgi:hypothetical protein
MTFAISITVRVVEVFEKFQQRHISGTGKDWVCENVSIGWFVLYEGSYEALYVGAEKPSLAPGDTICITFRKV